MSEHIVSSFDDQMQAVSEELARMGKLVRTQLSSALDALELSDAQIARRVSKNDRQVDAINADIEERVMTILALRQPMAIDLRETIAALKIARELERVGDIAKNTAKRSQIIFDFPKVGGVEQVIRMGRLAVRGIENVMIAQQAQDAEHAIEVWNSDEAIDNHCNEVFHRLLSGMMTDNTNINACTQMAFIAKNFERVGDHVTNIAESIYFVRTGEHIEESRPKSDTTSSVAVPELSAQGRS